MEYSEIFHEQETIFSRAAVESLRVAMLEILTENMNNHFELTSISTVDYGTWLVWKSKRIEHAQAPEFIFLPFILHMHISASTSNNTCALVLYC